MADVHFEIERKYLIEYPDIPWLESFADGERAEIVQTYLRSEGGETRRVRRWASRGEVRYYETVKRRISGIKCEENERAITEDEYRARLTLADPDRHPIQKTRYRVPYGGKLLEIDVYPFWQDRAILEIELEDESENPPIPQQLRVIREVTDDGRYKNAALAKKWDFEDELWITRK